jgi:hypothetical protein
MFKNRFIQQKNIYVVNGLNLKLYRMDNNLIPKQSVGSKLDLSSEISFNTLLEAQAFFELAKQRLMNVNQWDEICKAPSSVFRLMNSKGQEIAGSVKESDFIRIDIPGPGSKVGDGYDWVRVEMIAEQQIADEEILSITVRPSHHPLKRSNETAHFFKAEATSTFQVKRNGNVVYAEIHGRNEMPNNTASHIFDKMRNTLIGWFAKIGFSYPQWKCLAEGLVKN